MFLGIHVQNAFHVLLNIPSLIKFRLPDSLVYVL